MTFLIDGYNLMHAAGLARQGLPAGALHRKRLDLLDWLASVAVRRDTVIRVVFDAMNVPTGSAETDHRGVRVLFAAGRTADDEIEDLLMAEGRPSSVTVVSNDGRLRESARRRGAVFRSCEEFIDWAIAPRPPEQSTPPQAPSEKPEPVPSEAERAAWLAAFSEPKAKRRRRSTGM